MLWIDREQDLDAVTALSGSGPAYISLLAESMARAGARLGLDPVQAEELARLTVAGAGSMLAEPGALRQAVTRPGGTTQAALRILARDPNGLADLMAKAMSGAAAWAATLDGRVPPPV